MNRSSRQVAVIGATVLALLANIQMASAAPAARFSSCPVPYARPYGIVLGPRDKVWFTNSTLDAKSGAVEFLYKNRKTRFHATPTTAAMPGSINFIPGSDSLWFTETNANKIARLEAGKITEYAIPTASSEPLDIQHGPDGAMWFTESGVGKVGRIDSTGKITEFSVGEANDAPTALIAQSGALWLTEVGSNRIGRLTTSGDVSHFATGPGQLTGDMTNTSEGSLWAPKRSSVVRLKPDGTLEEFPLPAGIVETGCIFGHREGVFIGAIKANGQGEIVSVTCAGQVEEFRLPRKYLLPIEMTLDPDGGFFLTVRSVPPGHSISMIWRLQLNPQR